MGDKVCFIGRNGHLEYMLPERYVVELENWLREHGAVKLEKNRGL